MFSKPNAIVYIRRNDLIVGGKRMSAGKLTIDKSVIDNLEVKDIEKFVDLTQNFFSEKGFKGKRVLVVLDQGIVFSKVVDINGASKDDITSYFDSYVSSMPFLPGQRACIQYINEDNLKLYATNTVVYSSIIDALKIAGARKIVAITPSLAYKIDFSVKSSEIIDQFMLDKKVRNNITFSTSNTF